MKYLLLSLLLLPACSYSADNNETEVFFSVTRAAARRALPPADALSLGGASAAGAPDSVAALLEAAAPLAVRRLNGPLGLATVSMRGCQARQTAVYLDDIRLPADITGTVDLSVLPAAGLGKVEVLPGSAASVYGAGAGGGVVNLFTRRLSPGARLAQAGAEFSSYNTAAYTAKAGAAGKAGEIFLAGAAVTSDGFQENSKVNKGSASGRASLNLGRAGRLSAGGLFSRLKTGLPSGTPVPAADWNGSRERVPNSLTDWQTSQREFGAVSWNAGNADYGFRADSSLSSNDIEAFQYGSVSAAKVTDKTLSGRLTVLGTAVLGAESTVSSLRSVTYGNHALHSAGFFAQNVFRPAPGVEITPAARLDRSGYYRGRVSPKLSAVYAPDEKWRFSASAGYGFQPPTFADLYNPWAAPAPGLKPETSLNSSAAVYYGAPAGWYAGLSAYYSDIRDRIALDPLTWAAANLDSAFNSGLEAQAGWRGEDLTLSAGWARGRSLARSGGTFERLNFSPRDRFTGSASAALAGFVVSADGRGVSEQYTGRGRTGLRLREYWVFGAKVSRVFGAAEAWLGAENLLDRHYAGTADAFNGWFPQPGRTFSAGLKFTFM
ncbi:MAG: TonB-dependent receptor [Elusimicrobiales bacterium]|nr:TonB-dependent receptor [Elusimicrobiales bacterium]